MSQAETPAHQAAVAKQRFERFGMGVGGDIKILGLPPQQQIAHATPHQVGLKTGAFQAV